MSPTDLQSPNCKLQTRNSACLPPSPSTVPPAVAHCASPLWHLAFSTFSRGTCCADHTHSERRHLRRVIDLSSADRQTEKGRREKRRQSGGQWATCHMQHKHMPRHLCLMPFDTRRRRNDDDGDGALWPPLRALGVASNVLKASSHLGVAAERRGVEGVRGAAGSA